MVGAAFHDHIQASASRGQLPNTPLPGAMQGPPGLPLVLQQVQLLAGQQWRVHRIKE